MIVKFLKGKNQENSLQYNNDKVTLDSADRLACRNFPDDSPQGIKRTFERYERLNIRTRNTAFHLTLNPNEKEQTEDDDLIIRYTDSLMEKIGYGKQPYIIFKHRDIARIHYHIVSISTGPDGRKINDSFSQLTLRNAVRELGHTFPFTLQERQHREKTKENEILKILADSGEEQRHPSTATSFDRMSGTLSTQVKEILGEVFRQDFRTFEEFREILAERNVGMRIQEKTGRISFFGMENGNRITNLYPGKLSQDRIISEIKRRESRREASYEEIELA